MSKAERLQQFIDYKGGNVNSFEKSIGTRSTISKFLTSDSNLGINWIAKIIENYPDFNVEWFFTGKGEMLKNSTNGTDNESSSSDIQVVQRIHENKKRFWKIKAFRLLVESFFLDLEIEKEMSLQDQRSNESIGKLD